MSFIFIFPPLPIRVFNVAGFEKRKDVTILVLFKKLFKSFERSVSSKRMSDKDDDGDSGSIGLANSRSKRDKSKKVTNRLAALAALKATRDSGKKHLAEVDDLKVNRN